tara:strand:- start:1194 stop:1877 length:684 start_codon:yes stop_codon:yes gene_type:complete
MNEELDIAALESISVAENYNKYVADLFFSNIDKTENILDFGAGYGLITEKFKKKGYKISAVEINKTALEKLNDKNIDSYNLIEKVPKSINCIISLNVLEHIEDDDKYIKKFYNHLPQDGKLILYLPSSNLIWTELDDMVNHKRRYSKSGIVELLNSNSFEIEKIFFVDFIGWIVLFFLKMFRVKLDFDKRKIKFYDKFIFRTFKFTDYFFKNIIGKNLFIVASKKKN